ncbi:hypothetical protein JCM10296v2_002265 [Rhodotorula toruloides]
MGLLDLLRAKRRKSRVSLGEKSTPTRLLRLHRTRSLSQPTLPAEIVLYIFHLAFVDNPASACTLALLCSETRDRVRTALYTAPTLRSTTQINAFIRTVKRNPRLAGMVQRVRLDGCASRKSLAKGIAPGPDPQETGRRNPLTTRLSTLLELCANVVELCLVRTVVFSLLDFDNGHNVRHLTLSSCVLSDRTTTSRYHPFFTVIPALESLTIRNTQFDTSTAAHFLSPRTLPKLSILSLNGCNLVDEPGSLNDLGPYEPVDLAPNLESLELLSPPSQREAENVVDPLDIVAKSPSLRNLVLPVSSLSAHVLDNLPVSHLTHLTVLPPAQGMGDLFEPHLAAARALSTSFLALASSSASASASPAYTPFRSRTPISASPSTPPTPLALTPFPSPGLASPLSSPFGTDSPSPLSQLLVLTLPQSWDFDTRTSWKTNGEFAWAVGRIRRECERRGVEIRWVEEGREGGRKVADWAGEKERLQEEMERVRRDVERAQRGS